MRVVIQRVTEAEVKAEDTVTGKIGRGLLILLGIEDSDSKDDVEWLTGKISRLRIFNDEQRIMNRSVIDIGGEVMVVSQFTLHASTKKGNRPSYIKAAGPEKAVPLYESFNKELGSLISKKVQTGVFGAMMEISLINDGPVTIIIDSKNRE
jgi:D-tyrosyl-tRNA(Tyr) deacylase